MIVSELLLTLAHNPELKISVYDSDGKTNLIVFNAAGYESLSSELNARTVNKITLAEESKLFKVYLKEAPIPDPDPDPDPTPDPDPGNDPNNDPDPSDP